MTPQKEEWAMISGIKSVLLIICIFIVACNPLSESDSLKQNIDTKESERLQPKVELVAGGYAPQNLWAGQWRIINIWAEWCKPCWQEIPELNQFYAAQDEGGVKLLGFNFDELEQAELAILKEKMSIQFPVLSLWPDVWTKPDIRGLPATVILSPDGLVVDVLWGPQSLSSLNKGLEEAREVIKDRVKES